MRDIILDLSHPCPGTLASIDGEAHIGCAMGEVLFQAGVPLDVISKYQITDHLLARHPDMRHRVEAFIGRKVTEGVKRKISIIEINYDGMVASDENRAQDGYPLPREQYRDLMLAAGRVIGVNFILDHDGSLTRAASAPKACGVERVQA